MKLRRYLIFSMCLVLVAGCGREPPARTVSEFLDEPMLLEAALVRCTENRAEKRYESECVNVREAVKLLEARDEARRRAEREAQSQRKRESLRRTQQAAAEARRRAVEAERNRKEAEYQAQFGVTPPVDDRSAADSEDQSNANSPIAIIPKPVDQEPAAKSNVNPVPAAGSNAPIAETESRPDDESAPSLDAIRKELQQRNEGEDGS